MFWENNFASCEEDSAIPLSDNTRSSNEEAAGCCDDLVCEDNKVGSSSLMLEKCCGWEALSALELGSLERSFSSLPTDVFCRFCPLDKLHSFDN